MYEYGNIEDVKLGDIVEMNHNWSKYDQPKGKISIVQEINEKGSVVIKDKRSEKSRYTTKYVKLIKTKPSDQAEIGDTIILVKDRAGSHKDRPKRGTVCKIIKIDNSPDGIRISTNIPSPIGDPTWSISLDEFVVLVKEKQNQNNKGQEMNQYLDQSILREKGQFIFPEITNEIEEMFSVLSKYSQSRQFKAFDKKGNLNSIGLVYQCAKFGLTDERPFIVEAIKQELDDFLFKKLLNLDLKELRKKAAKRFNIKLIAKLDVLIKTKNSLIPELLAKKESKEYFKAISNVYCLTKEIEKELEENKKFKWIKKYLTKENLDQREFTLFDSKKLNIKIKEGKLIMLDKTIEEKYPVDIHYSKETDSFYL